MKKVLLVVGSIISFPICYVINLLYNIVITIFESLIKIFASEGLLASLFQLVLFPFVLVFEVLFQVFNSFYVAFCISSLIWNGELKQDTFNETIKSSHKTFERKKSK